MSTPEDRHAAIRRSRRNLIKLAAVGTPALLASLMIAKPAASDPFGCHQKGRGPAPCRCFLKGTKIRTVDGDKNVEDLVPGDLLPAVFGGVRSIQWVGRYRFTKQDASRHWDEDKLPVRIARSALGPGIPSADLFVTKSHAVLIDGVLVPAENLLNGSTITLYEASDSNELEFFHVRLASHDVIYAEDAGCETLLSVDESALNFAEYVRQYGLPVGEDTPCAPVLSFNGRRSEIKARFRSVLSPWIDRRKPLDVIRDDLEERGVVRFVSRSRIGYQPPAAP